MSLHVVGMLVAALAGEAPMKPATVAILRLEAVGLPAATAGVVSDEVVRLVKEDGLFAQVRTPGELDVMLGTVAQQQLRRCATDACAVVDTEIAGALGVGHLLVGRAAKLGDAMLVQLRLLDLETALEVASSSQRANGTNEALLLDAAQVAVRALLAAARVKLAPAPKPVERASSSSGPALPLLVAGGGVGALGAALLAGAIASVVAGTLLYVVPYYVVPISTAGVPRDARPFVFSVPSVALNVLGVLVLVGGMAAAVAGVALIVRGVLP